LTGWKVSIYTLLMSESVFQRAWCRLSGSVGFLRSPILSVEFLSRLSSQTVEKFSSSSTY